jgi:hypothetical protein
VQDSAPALAICTPIPSPFYNLEARREFGKLEEWAFSEEPMKRPIHEIEAEIFERGREVLRKMLEAHIRARGVGDVGPGVEVAAENGEAVSHTHRRLQVCNESTLFGDVRIERLAYHHPGEESIRPLDEQMQLPERSFSYPVQHMLVRRVVQGPFDEAIDTVNQFTGLSISKHTAETITQDAATDFDDFYNQRTLKPPEETGIIVVGTVDGKGVPMVKEERATPVVRLGRGEKANKKKMATVAAVYTAEPRVRTPDEVLNSLFRPELKAVAGGEKSKPPRQKPEQKRVWASLRKSKDDIIQEVGVEMNARDPKHLKKHVVVTDGERALQHRVIQHIAGVLLILDFLHVLERLWSIAHIFHKEGSLEAQEFARYYAGRLLHGQVSQVVKGIGQKATKRGIKGAQRKIIDGALGYLYANRDRMRYDRYLAEGLPIASGAVEGACKNLVKDRMERSGMRWKLPTAEAVLRMRALYLSDDFDEYWAFHIKQEQARLRGNKTWSPISID